jgi:hypothetical protein
MKVLEEETRMLTPFVVILAISCLCGLFVFVREQPFPPEPL